VSALKGGPDRSVRVLEDFWAGIRLTEKQLEEELIAARDVSSARNHSEKAWIVMLAHQGIVSRKDAAQILKAILDYEKESQPAASTAYLPSDSFSVWSLEKTLTARLGAGLAGNLNISKTLPEPMARLKIRDACLPLFDALLEFFGTLQELAARYRETVMPGYTHLAQTQVRSFGHYLLSVHDPILRALKELEAAYANTNLSTLGCGALAGSSWPLDRLLAAELLGFDGIVENANDCVSSADYALSIPAALVNIMNPVSRVTLDLQIWGMEEVSMISVIGSFSDTSSMMPQKKKYGGQLERTRVESAMIISRLQEVAVLTKSEPFSDLLAVIRIRYPVMEALCIVKKNLRILRGFLSVLVPDEQKMLELCRKGFACASELANTIVRCTDLSYRQAHHVTGTVVRLCSERGISANRVDASLVEEAAALVVGKSLGLDDEEVRRALDPRCFIAAHAVRGGAAPQEVARMTEQRASQLKEAVARQAERMRRLQATAALLDRRIAELLEAGCACRGTARAGMRLRPGQEKGGRGGRRGTCSATAAQNNDRKPATMGIDATRRAAIMEPREPRRPWRRAHSERCITCAYQIRDTPYCWASSLRYFILG
jgi:argininosuccinate lyase